MPRRNNTYYRSRSKRAVSLLGGLVNWLRGIVRSRRNLISPRFFLLGLLVAFLVAVLCTQIVSRQVEKARLKYQVSQLREQNLELRMSLHRKRIKVSRLQNPERIQRIAVSELGMELADTVPVMEVSRRHWARLPLDRRGD